MKRPRVTIVLPVRNGAATIAGTIASVNAQTFADFELLVVDDGSTDDTLRVVAGVADARARVIPRAPSGPAASRNAGIREARGELVAFVDADDLWLPGKLDAQVRALDREPRAALAYSFNDCIDAAGRFLAPGGHVRAEGDVYERLLLGNFLECGSTPLVRAGAFVEAGLFDESLGVAEDWEMYLRLARAGAFVCVPEVQVLYRVHPRGISSDTRRQEAAHLAVLAAALARLPEGADRSGIARDARAGLYRYLAGREVRAATGRGSALRAARWLGKYVATAPASAEGLRHALVQGARIARVLVAGPPRQA